MNNPELYTELENESRLLFLHPWMREYINAFEPRRILDYGCGDGSLLYKYSGKYELLTLFDNSEKMLNIARSINGEQEKIEYISDTDRLHAERYDMVICCLVLMTIGTEKELRYACEEMHRAADRGANCVVSITHPCFRNERYSTFETEYASTRYNYLMEGARFRVTMRDDANDKIVMVHDYHWTLSKNINVFTDTGYKLIRLIELPDKGNAGGYRNREYPAYIIMHYVKE